MKTLAHLLLAVMPLSAHALSLREAAVAALAHDPRFAAAAAGLDSAQAQKKLASAGYLPTVAAGADVGYSDFETQAPYPPSGTRYPNTLGVSVSQPLYEGGRTHAQVSAAEATLDSALQTQRDAGGKVILAALTAYLDVKRDRQILALNQATERALALARDDSAKRYTAGEATTTDVAQANARLAEAHAGVARAQAALRVSEAAFLRYTGREPEQLDAPWPENLNLPSSLDQVRTLAAAAPTVLSGEASARAAHEQIAAARAEALPRLSLDGSAATQDDSNFGYQRLDTWALQLKLQVPIYTGGAIDARVADAQARAAQARFAADDLRNQIVEAADREWTLLQANAEVIEASRAQSEAAELALSGVRKELAVGTRTTLDLLNAEREQLSAQVNLAAAQHDRAVTAFRLLAACGQLELVNIPE